MPDSPAIDFQPEESQIDFQPEDTSPPPVDKTPGESRSLFRMQPASPVPLGGQAELNIGSGQPQPRSTAESLTAEQAERQGHAPMVVRPGTQATFSPLTVPLARPTAAPVSMKTVDPFTGDTSLVQPQSPEEIQALRTRIRTGQTEMPGVFEGHPENIGEYATAFPRTARGIATMLGKGELVTPEGRKALASGLEQAMSGVGEITAPAAVFTPGATARFIAGGMLGSYGAKKAAAALHASPDTQKIAAELAGLLGGMGGEMAYGAASRFVNPQDALADLLWKRGYIEDRNGTPIHIQSQADAQAVAQEIIKQNPQGLFGSLATGMRARAAANRIPAREAMGVATEWSPKLLPEPNRATVADYMEKANFDPEKAKAMYEADQAKPVPVSGEAGKEPTVTAAVPQAAAPAPKPARAPKPKPAPAAPPVVDFQPEENAPRGTVENEPQAAQPEVSAQPAPVPGERPAEQTPAPAKTEAVGEKPAQTAPEPKYKYRSTQTNIPDDSEAAKALESARQRISDSDVAAKGKDVGGNHVTVRYGLKTDDVEGVRNYLKNLTPFEAALGKTEKFEPSESSDGAAVIQAPIESPELHQINAELEKHGDFIEPTFKEYKPHATVAYVKPEAADRYVGMSVTHGKKFKVDSIAITDREGKQEIVKLEGKGGGIDFQPEPGESAEASAAVPQEPKPEAEKVQEKEVKLSPAAIEREKLGLPPEPGEVGYMRVASLKVDPQRFQYKLSTDAQGTSTLLKETKVFNPDLAGIVSVWRDPKDGKTNVVNGHHRVELAQRTTTKRIIVRHIKAKDAVEARAIGALQNIAEGRGTAIDAAKFFRDTGITPENLKEKGVSLGEATASNGVALSRLDTPIFNKVVSGELRPGRAIAIGEATSDPAEQKAILSLVEKKEKTGGKVSDDTLSELIRLVKGSQQTSESTADLFGTQQINRSLALEKAEISAHIKQQLAKDRKIFGFVAKESRATELARGGNKIDVEKSKEISTGAAQAEEVYNKLSSRGGPISSILDEAARRLADGENAATVKSEAYQRVRDEVSQTLAGAKETGVGRPEGTSETPDSGLFQGSIEPSRELFTDPKTGELKTRIGMNRERGIRMTITGLYKDRTAAKMTTEMVQNAFDEVMQNPDPSQRKITFLAGSDNELADKAGLPHGTTMGTIEIRDTGRGMTPEQLGTVFTDVYESGKTAEEGAAGGWGVAKTSFQLGGRYFRAESAVRGKDGKVHVYVIEGTPEELLAGVPIRESGAADKTGFIAKLFGTGQQKTQQTGLSVKVWLDPKRDPYTFDALAYFERAAQTTPADITFKRSSYKDGTPVTVEKAATKDFGKLDIPGAQVRMALSEEVASTPRGYAVVRVLNQGLYQFDTSIYLGGDDIVDMPDFIVADVSPTVRPGHEDYPFTQSRETLTGNVEKGIRSHITEKLVNKLRELRRDALRREWNSITEIPVQSSEGKQLPVALYDELGAMGSDFLKTPYWQQYLATIREAQQWFLDALPAATGHRPIKKLGVFFPLHRVSGSQRSVIFGINIPNPSGENEGVFLNPLGTGARNEIFPERPTFETALQMARHQWNTLVHEFAHNEVRSHGVSFEGAMAEINALIPPDIEHDFVNRLAASIAGTEEADYDSRPSKEYAEALQRYIRTRRDTERPRVALGGTGIDSTSLGSRQNFDARTQGNAERLPASLRESGIESAATPGLTDEELEQWSKSRGFRTEDAGEQLGMFGDGDKVLRAFRIGPKGKEQSGLIYQSQLDNLQRGPEQTGEPFTLTGGEAREEQPRLFGAGDLGEILGPTDKQASGLPAKEKGTSLFASESGQFEPSKLTEPAKIIADYLRNERDLVAQSRELQSGMYDLESQYNADVLRAVQTMETLNKALGKNAIPDYERIYHYLEDPSVRLTNSQRQTLDDIIRPLMSESDRIYEKLSAGGVPVDNYVHRVVKNKGNWFDRIVSGSKGGGRGNLLSKSAPQTKSRTMYAIESPGGERRVVSLKGGQVTAWDHGTPENLGSIMHTEEGKSFEDKDGNIWTLKQATTKEIEEHTNLEYYHNALASSLVSFLQLRKAERGFDFIESFKSDPDFQKIAVKEGGGAAPKGWKQTDLPQLRGYYFEPHTAEVLDWYSQKLRQEGPGIFDQVGALMKTAMLINPLFHPMNVGASWTLEKGVSGVMPWNWLKMGKAGVKAIKAVLEQNDDFLAALDAGAPLQSQRDTVRRLAELFFDQLGENVRKQDPVAISIVKALGFDPKHFGPIINPLHKLSSKVAWLSNDILFLQSAYEKQAGGMNLKDALKETARIIPDYRLPTRVLDSRTLAKAMGERRAFIFAPYHYGLMKTFPEMAKSMFGLHQPPPGETKAGDVWHGWNMLALMALIVYGLYPLLDEAAKKISGDAHAKFRRSGPFGVIENLRLLAAKEKTPPQVATSLFTPNPLTKALIEGVANHELETGHQVYDPNADWKTKLEQIEHYLKGTVSTFGQVQQATETESGRRKFLWGQVGVTFPRSGAEKVAQNIASAKSDTKAWTEEQRQRYYAEQNALEELRKGNSKPMFDALGQHLITSKQAHDLMRRAKLTWLQDKVHNFSYEETLEVYNASGATPEQKRELLPILRRKRDNLIMKGERAEALPTQ